MLFDTKYLNYLDIGILRKIRRLYVRLHISSNKTGGSGLQCIIKKSGAIYHLCILRDVQANVLCGSANKVIPIFRQDL